MPRIEFNFENSTLFAFEYEKSSQDSTSYMKTFYDDINLVIKQIEKSDWSADGYLRHPLQF